MKKYIAVFVMALAMLGMSVSGFAQAADEESSEAQRNAIIETLMAGYQTALIHQHANTMTQTDKRILKIIDEEYPKLLRKIRTTIYDIKEPLDTLVKELTQLLIDNQNEYPAPANMKYAEMIASSLAMMLAVQDNKVDSRVVNVLVNEIDSISLK